MHNERVRELISRTIDGMEALVNAESGEIYIEIPAENAQFIHVKEGDTVQEGDIRSRTAEELEAPSLTKWTIETIGRETVVGTDQETGEPHEWDRKSLEKKLAIGEFSTNLRDFDRVSVAGATTTSNHDERLDEDTITVVLHGNDGQKFTQTYRLVDADSGGNERRVELTESDERLETIDSDLQMRFRRAVEQALRDEGYAT